MASGAHRDLREYTWLSAATSLPPCSLKNKKLEISAPATRKPDGKVKHRPFHNYMMEAVSAPVVHGGRLLIA